ncbi:diguanylate cyclase [Neptunicella sp. SCSIO 80796]|uniref:sensor domain-containing diguanylate cyclase n=1 Tax=Neptunicella plasticusilytica TaxID=3117012 RepID=UPI003A4DD400
MQAPVLPQDEENRLLSLQSLNVLDTAAEERFDRLTRLAKRLFDVPIALVSLVDKERQWFKSCVGLDVRETPRDVSFCGHAILGHGVFVINDTALDNRFIDNPLVTSAPHIRFYAGCPLKHSDGSKLGTLCIIDDKPRLFSRDDIIALEDLAAMAEQELIAVQLATLDELTGISNRRGFINLAEQSLKMSIRHQYPVSLIYFDLDHFKQINDKHGHAEGDKALKNFAHLMQETFRESDVFGRIGGDEFVVLLVNSSETVAKETLWRFQQSLADYNANSNRQYELLCTSGLVNCTADKDSSIQSMLDEADKLMYDKKQSRKRNAG